MKKILLLFLIISLSSCLKSTKIENINDTTLKGEIPFNNVIHFEYQNHEYIKFYYNYYNVSHSSVVHNPDCKYCKK